MLFWLGGDQPLPMPVLHPASCRSKSELDPVTLHNMALVHMDKSPGAGFKKLNFLLSSEHFPPETFANLLLLYCAPQHGFLDLAADVMAENPDYCATLLSKVGAVLSQPAIWPAWFCALSSMMPKPCLLHATLQQGAMAALPAAVVTAAATLTMLVNLEICTCLSHAYGTSA